MRPLVAIVSGFHRRGMSGISSGSRRQSSRVTPDFFRGGWPSYCRVEGHPVVARGLLITFNVMISARVRERAPSKSADIERRVTTTRYPMITSLKFFSSAAAVDDRYP